MTSSVSPETLVVEVVGERVTTAFVWVLEVADVQMESFDVADHSLTYAISGLADSSAAVVGNPADLDLHVGNLVLVGHVTEFGLRA